MFNFDIPSIFVNAIISAVILFFVGVFTKRKFGFNLGKAISFIKMCFVVFVPFLVFWWTHQAPSLKALQDLSVFLPEYLINGIGALFGLAIGDVVGSILEGTYQSP